MLIDNMNILDTGKMTYTRYDQSIPRSVLGLLYSTIRALHNDSRPCLQSSAYSP
jgi:hypothetical protein